MKKVDKLGRIVIPQQLREKYGLTEGKEIDFFDAGDGITVKPQEALCKICRCKIKSNLVVPLCESCIEKVVKNYNRS